MPAIKPARGSAHYCAKLTPANVREIVRRYKKGGISTYQLAKEFGVIQASIMQVLTGRSWSRVTGIKFGSYKSRRARIPLESVDDSTTEKNQ